LRGLLGAVRVSSNVKAELWIDDRHLGEAPGTRLVPAGRHVVELRAPLYESVRREVDVHARGEQPLRFSLQRLSKYEGPNPAFFWTSAGLTLVALTTGTVLGVNALTANADGKMLQEQAHYLPTLDDEKHVKHLALAADVAFGAAAVLAVTSTVLFFVTDFDADGHEHGPAATPRAKVRFEPWVGRGSAGLSVQGALR
jgi:hypothetical protein